MVSGQLISGLSSAIEDKILTVDALKSSSPCATHTRHRNNTRASLKMLQALSRHQKHALDIDTDLLVEILQTRLFERYVRRIQACAVEDMIEVAKLGDYGPDKGDNV